MTSALSVALESVTRLDPRLHRCLIVSQVSHLIIGQSSQKGPAYGVHSMQGLLQARHHS